MKHLERKLEQLEADRGRVYAALPMAIINEDQDEVLLGGREEPMTIAEYRAWCEEHREEIEREQRLYPDRISEICIALNSGSDPLDSVGPSQYRGVPYEKP